MASVRGTIVDVVNGRLFPGEVVAGGGRILSVNKLNSAPSQYITPVLVDAHVHVESSLLVPAEFARIAVMHGVGAAVADPHEIANVCGVGGVRFMIENGGQVPFKFAFGAPSCVPATPFETAGAKIGTEQIEELLQSGEASFLAEMMNWPGVLSSAPDVTEKIAVARKYGKPVDGHAPGLKGEQARRYIEAGISTDHECVSADEAIDKLKYGMKVSVREGSAAKDFEALAELLEENWRDMMFCTDDAHPDFMLKHYMAGHVRRALSLGIDPLKVLSAASLNPVRHYNLPVGLLQPGDPADFAVVEDLKSFVVLETHLKGEKVFDRGSVLLERKACTPINNFNCSPVLPGALKVEAKSNRMRVIEAAAGSLITGQRIIEVAQGGDVAADSGRDILKLVVVNRYQNAAPAVAFVSGFGLKDGALASSVGHDSHNVLAIGTNDEDLATAINLVVEAKGGLSAASSKRGLSRILRLPVAGLMTAEDAFSVADTYSGLDMIAKDMGSGMQAPFMTLSFLALLVIPELKLSDKGLFDGRSFRFVEPFV